jgi:hypothetical protein
MGPLVMGHFVMGRFVMGSFVCESLIRRKFRNPTKTQKKYNKTPQKTGPGTVLPILYKDFSFKFKVWPLGN